MTKLDMSYMFSHKIHSIFSSIGKNIHAFFVSLTL